MRKHGSREEPARFHPESRQAVLNSAFGDAPVEDARHEATGDSRRIASAHTFARCGMTPQPHGVEQAVQRQLLGHPDLKFSSLVIRRIRDGVCLEGFVEGSDGLSDACRLARTVDGVNQVLNHLVVRQPVQS